MTNLLENLSLVRLGFSIISELLPFVEAGDFFLSFVKMEV